MSKKLLALAAAGALSFTMIGCDVFGSSSSSSGTSSGTSSSSVVATDSVFTYSASASLGGSTNTTYGSYIDVTTGTVYKSADVSNNASVDSKIDLVFAPDNTYAQFLTPVASSNSNLTGSSRVYNLTGTGHSVDVTKIKFQSQIDSLYNLVSSGSGTSATFIEGDVLVVNAHNGQNILVAVNSLTDNTTAAVTTVSVTK